MTNSKLSIAAVAASLILGLLAIVPTTSAHTCADHYTCDASACKDGEAHEHTDYNDDTEDGYCKSEADKPGNDCWYFGHRFPGAVCRLIEADLESVLA